MKRGEIFKKELIKQLKEVNVKSKDMKKLLHAFDILNDVAFNVHRDIKEPFFVAYKISEYVF